MKNLNFKNYLKVPILIISASLVFGACKKEEEEDMTGNGGSNNNQNMESMTYNYEFNNGQVVASAPYSGAHMDNLTASMMVEEMGANETKISVTLTNTVNGETYHIHAHDAADPADTPNGTPYNETPNGDVFSQMATGNGGEVTVTQTISMSYSDITSDYEGFFVVHDPLQGISTTDISTYLIVGLFAREQGETNYSSSTFNYDFNTGQVDAAFEYDGAHASNLSAMLKIQELAEGSRVSVVLMNSLSGEMYMVHAHDMADPNDTPNGTPYDETPNGDVLSLMIEGNGGNAHMSQTSSMSYNSLTSMYEAFFVVHDPLQAISTTDPTTYVILGVFAD